MTKKEAIDTLHEKLGEYFRSNDEGWVKQMCEQALNAAYNQAAVDLTTRGLRKVLLSRKRFTGLAVTWDSGAATYYSDYPAAIIPNLNTELLIDTIKAGGFKFYLAEENQRRLAKGLKSEDYNTRIPVILKRERIEYDNMESLTQDEIDLGASPTPKISTVRMDLAIEFREYADTDEVYMPAGNDYLVYQLAEDWLTNKEIIDLRNE